MTGAFAVLGVLVGIAALCRSLLARGSGLVRRGD